MKRYGIAAPPEQVWPHVLDFPELPPPHQLVLLAGIAYPEGAHLEGRGVGAIRRCEFSTGAFVEPIGRNSRAAPGTNSISSLCPTGPCGVTSCSKLSANGCSGTCVPSPSARGEDIFALGCRADLKPRHIPELF